MGLLDKLKGVLGGARTDGAAARRTTEEPADPVDDDAEGTDDDGDGIDSDEDGFTPVAKDGRVVAARLVVTILVARLARTVSREEAGAREEALGARKAVFDSLVSLGMSPDDLEAAERELAFGLRAGRVAPHAVTGARWRLEGASALAWALGLRDAFPSESEAADLAALRGALPSDAAHFEAFAAGASTSLRPLSVLMAQRAVWMERMLPMLEQPPSDVRSRTIERLRALLWLVDPEATEDSAACR